MNKSMHALFLLLMGATMIPIHAEQPVDIYLRNYSDLIPNNAGERPGYYMVFKATHKDVSGKDVEVGSGTIPWNGPNDTAVASFGGLVDHIPIINSNGNVIYNIEKEALHIYRTFDITWHSNGSVTADFHKQHWGPKPIKL
jgi:hypothetical protein